MRALASGQTHCYGGSLHGVGNRLKVRLTLALFAATLVSLLAASPSVGALVPRFALDGSPGPSGSYPFDLTDLNGTLLFSA